MSLPNHCKFFAATGSGVKLFVRLSPKAKREGVEGVYTDPDGLPSTRRPLTAKQTKL